MTITAYGLHPLLKADRSSLEEDWAIPLIGVEVLTDITGKACKVKVRQTYENRGKDPVEAIYKFPLPEGALVCGFKAHVGDKVFAGKVEERDKAYEKYDDAVTEGDGGYLFDQERPNIFTIRAGNMNPGTKAVLEVEYVELLENNGEEVRFFLPTTISPRYIPERMDDVDGMPPGDIVNPPISMNVPYGLKLRITIQDRDAISSIESPSHKINVQMGASPLIVELSEETSEMDRDFILNIKYKTGNSSRAYAVQKGAETFYQVDFCPQMPTSAGANGPGIIKKDIVFLLDCSGSMEGESIAQVKKAIGVFIKAMQEGTNFNVYTFGSSFNKVFSESVPYNSLNVRKALNALSTLEADLGGTEIMAPLRDILERDGVGGIKEVIILTDGQFGNEEEVFDLVNGARKRARIFTVGISHGPNEYFFKHVARTSGGAFEHIAPGERIEPKVIRLLSKIAAGAVTDLKIHWPGKAVQAPEYAIAFLGTSSSLFGRVSSPEHADNIKISGTLSGKQVEWSAPVSVCSDSDSAIPRLWAREKIRDLAGSVMGRVSSTALVKDNNIKEVTRQTVALSVEFQIMSNKASFVAVEERDENNKTIDKAVTLKVPSRLTRGWGGSELKFSLGSVSYCTSAPLYSVKDAASGMSEPSEDQVLAEENKRYERHVAIEIVFEMLNSQILSGGFELTEYVASFLTVTEEELRQTAYRIDAKNAAEEIKFQLLITALVLEYLKLKCASQADWWQPAVEKSKLWFMQECKNTGILLEGKTLEKWAEDHVNAL